MLNPFTPYGDGSLAANLVAIDAANPAEAIATVVQPFWGSKEGRRSFKRTRTRLHRP